MNECIKVLTSRRSIKKYESKPVPEELLEEILKAGINAPTGKNMQTPVMVAVTNPETLKLVRKLNADVLGTTSDPFYGAPAVIVVFASKEFYTYVEDGSLVMGNLLNAAASLGLGACWIHRAREAFETPEGKKLKEKWGLDDRYVGIGNCIVGYPAEERAPLKHKEDYVIYDK